MVNFVSGEYTIARSQTVDHLSLLYPHIDQKNCSVLRIKPL